MATQKSDALEQLVLTTFLQGGTWTGNSIEVALFTTMPSEDGTGGVEVSGLGYIRQGFIFDFQSQDGNGDIFVSHSSDLLWDPAGDNWGSVVGIGIYDTAGPTLLYYGTLLTPLSINTGTRALFPAFALKVTEQ